MAGSITVSSITLDSDNNFSIKSNTGATLFFANTTGIDVANSLASSSITSDKILSVANTKITGNIVSSQITSVANTQITGNLTATNIAGGSNGTIPYQSAAGVTQMLAVGSSGQLLQTNGAGAPSWVTPSAGSLVYLSTVTANTSATVSITSGITSTYAGYIVELSDVMVDTGSNLGFIATLSSDNGGAYYSANYMYSFSQQAGTNSPAASSSGSASSISLISTSNGVNNNSSIKGVCGRIFLPNPSIASYYPFISWNLFFMRSTTESVNVLGSGGYQGAVAVLNGIRFAFSSGNILRGTFKLYGIVGS